MRIFGLVVVHVAVEVRARAVVRVEHELEHLAADLDRPRAADERHAINTARDATLELQVGQGADVRARIGLHHRAQLRPRE
jgi:hypothetical protein